MQLYEIGTKIKSFRADKNLTQAQLAKKSGIHLGHVFDDAPNGQKRFCINANVLEFKPK